MEKHYATVSSKGQLVIPAAIRTSMGIEAGTRVAFFQEGTRLVLQPETLAAKMRLIDELCGITAGGPSMCDELIADRRAEDKQSGW
jgi:AbrB family looped-hinge helix DNA binding protein